jgi:hypothetical protein
VKIEDIYHVRIDAVDKRVDGIGYEHIDTLQFQHTRDTGRRNDLVKTGSGGALGTPLLTTRISQTIGPFVVAEAVSTEVAHVRSPASNEA